MKCDEQINDDDSFEPNCGKCPAVRLLPDNELAVTIYQELNSAFIVNSNIQDKVFESFEDEMSAMTGREKRIIFRKMTLINNICRQFEEENTNRDE